MYFYFVCLMGFILAVSFMQYSRTQMEKQLSRVRGQIFALAEGGHAVRVIHSRRKSAAVIQLVREATGLSLPETARVIEAAPGRIPYVFKANEAEELVARLQALGAQAEHEPFHS